MEKSQIGRFEHQHRMWNLDINCLLVNGNEMCVCFEYAIVTVAVAIIVSFRCIDLSTTMRTMSAIWWRYKRRRQLKQKWIISKRENKNEIIVFSFALNSFESFTSLGRLFGPVPNISIWKVNFNNDVVNGSLDSIKQSSMLAGDVEVMLNRSSFDYSPFFFSVRSNLNTCRPAYRPWVVSFCNLFPSSVLKSKLQKITVNLYCKVHFPNMMNNFAEAEHSN